MTSPNPLHARSFDIAGLLDRLPPLSSWFERDGYPGKKSGSAFLSRCPFHEEKTPSCQIRDDQGKFNCFACGAHGDHLDYWQKTRGKTFPEALAELAALAGVSPDASWSPAAAAPARAPAVPKPVAPPSDIQLAKWTAAAAALAADDAEIARIADWRGIHPAAIRNAAESGLMGLYSYWNETREAFLVQAVNADRELIPVSVHCRLAPGSKGNDHHKASWRYDPSGVGSWPFVMGDPATADHLFVMEGQWDALALAALMGWHLKWPVNTAVFGLRGATSGAKLLTHPINPEACVFTFSDADPAGDQWFEPGGFLDLLAARLTHPHRLHCFRPCAEGADFNDLVKDGSFTRDTILSYVLPCLPRPDLAKPPTFTSWCRAAAKHAADPVVKAAAKYVVKDPLKPPGRRPVTTWLRHWRTTAPDELLPSLAAAWDAYRRDIAPPAAK